MLHAHTFPKEQDGYFMIESIHDPIEVITMFTAGRMKPIRFRWKSKTVKIAKVTGDWVRHEGQNKIHYFALLADNADYYEIRYDSREMTWQLTRVWMEGCSAVRVVAHVDMDAFFASVEEKMNPRLAGHPLAVGGDLKRRGVVASANYEARKFGVRAGMPNGEALRLCPDLTIVEGNPQKYVHISLQILEVLKDFTPFVEPFSIDEAFLDLAGAPRLMEGKIGTVGTRSSGDLLALAVPIARAIQRAIHRRTDLTATIGIGPNKYIAKMASGVEKPRGLTALTQEDYHRHFWPLGVKELWGIGEKTRIALEKLGITTIGQLAHFPKEFLTYHFGLNGDRMRDAALGDDDGEVVPYYKGVPVKSMGHEFTLSQDIDSRERISSHLLRLSDQVARRLRLDGYLGRIVAVKLRDSKFRTTIRQRALPYLMNDETLIFKTSSALLDENWDGRPLRLIGVSVSGLVASGNGEQPSLFDTDERRRKMIEAVDSLRDRFGDSALVRAGSIK